MTSLPRPCIALVTDRRQLTPGAAPADALQALKAWLDEAVDAGVDLIQVRERDLDGRALAGVVSALMPRARAARTRVLVNDRADVALAAGADGVHLPAAGLPTPRVRELSPAWVIGRSLHAGDVPDAEADYLLFGAVLPSRSKPAGWHAAGFETLRTVAAATRVPVLAIGGITPATAGAAAAAGAAGVAGIGVFLPPPRGMGPERAVDALRSAFETGRSTC
jgi:thiamine-phosphate pyrophosphorylase